MNKATSVVSLYARVSSERQAREGTIESQLHDLFARAGADGFTPPPELVFADDGYSGASLVRPALEQLRDAAAAGAFDRLYVHCPDRLAREFVDQIVLMDELHRAGVDVVFFNCNIDGSPEGEMLLQMQGVMAQYERAKIRERTRRGRQYAARCGSVAVLTGAPYGYRYIKKSECDGQAQYRVVLEEARVVRQIFDWVGRERCSLGEVVRRLARQGIPTREGLPRWDRRTLATLLENPAYKGTAGWNKTQQSAEPKPRLRPRRGQSGFPRRHKGVRKRPPEQWTSIPVPPLVPEETFAAAQEQLAHNRAHHGRPAVPGRYLLHGLLVCSRCGRAYCGGYSGRYGYYRCSGTDAYRFGGQRMCINGSVRTEELDAAVWGDVTTLLQEPGRVEAEYHRRLQRQDERVDHDREALETQITGLKRRIARLTEMYEEGFLEREEFQKRMTSAQSRQKGLEAEAAALVEQTTSESELRLVMGHLKGFADRLQSRLGECDWQARQSIVRALVKRIEIGETDMHVVYKVSPGPFEHTPQGGGVLQNCDRTLVALQATSDRYPVPQRGTIGKPGATPRGRWNAVPGSVPQRGTIETPGQRPVADNGENR
jgi:site-specific DNA recombinase